MRHLKLSLIGLLTFAGSLAVSGCGGVLVLNKATGTGALTLSTTSVNFGQVAVGKTASLTVTATNQGSAAVEISQLNLTGQSFSMSGANSLPLTVGANASVTFSLQFAPKASGSTTGQLSITSNASNGSSASVALSGTGVPMLTGLNCVNGSVTGAATDSCTVTLNATAASGGMTVSVTSGNSAVIVPATVMVPAGASSASFTATVAPVTLLQSAMLTASAGGVTQTFALQLGASLPTLGLSAAKLTFGSVAVNSAVTQSLVLSSTGTANVTVSAAAMTGSGFSISGEGLPVTLAPGQTATVSVQFNPTVAGTMSGQLTLSSNSSSGSTSVVTLSGTGVPVLSALTCASASVTGSATDQCMVTLNAAAASGGFTVNVGSNNSLVNVPTSVTVPAGASSASFTANVSPANSAETATLTASAGGVSKTFALALNSSVPTLTLSTSNVDFGDVVLNIAATQTVTLSSTGNAPVTVSASSLTGTGFAAAGASFPLTLNPNQTATLTVQFIPTLTGSATGQLTFTSNSADAALKRVGLAARGVPRISGLSCASPTMTGAGTDTCTVALNAPVPNGGLNVKLASSNPAITVPGALTLPAGATSGSFAAAVSAVNVAQIATLSANAAGVTQTTSVQLNAAAISLSVNPSSISFGNVNVNTPATQTLTLTSTGSSLVTVSAATVAGTGFSIPGASFPITLNANQSATLTVQFDPTAAGAATGQLTLTSNSASGTTTIVGLSGTGVPVLTGLACTTGSYSGSGTDSCTVTLNAAAATGGLAVGLSSNSSAVTVPASVTVPAGSSTANFAATVSSVSTSQTVTLTASVNNVAQTFALQLSAVVPVLSAFTCTIGSMTGAGTNSCTVTLNAAAPTGGLAVGLASSNSAVTVPASVTVPAGSTTAGFTATVSPVSSSIAVTLTASAGSMTKTFTLQLGAGVPTLSVNAASVGFGDVVINTPATQTLILSSTGTAALTINSATVSGTGFSISGLTFPLTLNPNQTATLNIVFDPTATGAATGQITVTSNSSTGSSTVVVLSGAGIATAYGVNLAWNPPTSSPDPVAGYNVYRSPSGASAYVQLNTAVVTQTTYSDTTVQNGQSYDYIVESVDASGIESAPSNTTTAVIP